LMKQNTSGRKIAMCATKRKCVMHRIVLPANPL
jgi:hypothetical protein